MMYIEPTQCEVARVEFRGEGKVVVVIGDRMSADMTGTIRWVKKMYPKVRHIIVGTVGGPLDCEYRLTDKWHFVDRRGL